MKVENLAATWEKENVKMFLFFLLIISSCATLSWPGQNLNPTFAFVWFYEEKRRDDDFAGDECLKCAESFALPVLQRALAASLILTQILSILTTTETLPNAQLTQTLRTQFDSFYWSSSAALSMMIFKEEPVTLRVQSGKRGCLGVLGGQRGRLGNPLGQSSWFNGYSEIHKDLIKTFSADRRSCPG